MHLKSPAVVIGLYLVLQVKFETRNIARIANCKNFAPTLALLLPPINHVVHHSVPEFSPAMHLLMSDWMRVYEMPSVCFLAAADACAG